MAGEGVYNLYDEYRGEKADTPYTVTLRRFTNPDPAKFVVVDRVEGYGKNEDGTEWTIAATVDKPIKVTKEQYDVLMDVALPANFQWDVHHGDKHVKDAVKTQAAALKKQADSAKKGVAAGGEYADDEAVRASVTAATEAVMGLPSSLTIAAPGEAEPQGEAVVEPVAAPVGADIPAGPPPDAEAATVTTLTPPSMDVPAAPAPLVSTPPSPSASVPAPKSTTGSTKSTSTKK